MIKKKKLQLMKSMHGGLIGLLEKLAVCMPLHFRQEWSGNINFTLATRKVNTLSVLRLAASLSPGSF